MSEYQAKLSRNQKALMEMYEIFCPNSNPHGLRDDRVNEFNREAVNVELKRVSVALKTFPDSIRRRWMGAEDAQQGKNEQTSQEDQPSLLEQAFKELSLDSPGAW
jgi:type IV secretory pathway VirB4 component